MKRHYLPTIVGLSGRPRARVFVGILAGVILAAGLVVTSVIAQQTAAASAPSCTTSALEVWLGSGAGEATAGSTYYPLEFTNESGHTCSLFGFPGVSAYNQSQLGSAASRVKSIKQTVIIAPGATAHTVLQIVDVGNFPPTQCKPVTAHNLRVYPPNQFSVTYIPFTFEACSAAGPIYLYVAAIQAGIGIPGHP